MKSENIVQKMLPGLISGVIVTWLGFFAYQYLGISFLPAGLSDIFFAVLPGSIQAEGIAILGYNAKPLTLYLFTLFQIVVLALMVRNLKFSVQSTVNMNLMALAIFFTISFTGASVGWNLLTIAIGAIGLITIHVLLTHLFSRALRDDDSQISSEAETIESEPNIHLPRRRVLAGLASGAGAVMLWPVISRALIPASSASSLPELKAPTTPLEEMLGLPVQKFDHIAGLPSAVTPQEEFYYVSKNIFVHSGSISDSLNIDGLVDTPFTITIDELKEMPAIEEFVTLLCIDYEPQNPTTNTLINNALWKGVPLLDLLNASGIDPSSSSIELHASDSYATMIPLSNLSEQPKTMIAYEMNGIPLSDRHGFPVRLIAPGLYGYKNVKHITQIDVTNREFLGYWERRGWAVEAPVKLMSRITTPVEAQSTKVGEPLWIAGIAHSGTLGISKVEVGLEGGGIWVEADIEDPLSELSWTRWAYQWTPQKTGRTTLQVRAYDGSGNIQEQSVSKAFPSGATGYHRVDVFVS
jgi:DMSO/TMAO reductase YedYZ molybdopterin-dependent catalytic subunit